MSFERWVSSWQEPRTVFFVDDGHVLTYQISLRKKHFDGPALFRGLILKSRNVCELYYWYFHSKEFLWSTWMSSRCVQVNLQDLITKHFVPPLFWGLIVNQEIGAFAVCLSVCLPVSSTTARTSKSVSSLWFRLSRSSCEFRVFCRCTFVQSINTSYAISFLLHHSNPPPWPPCL